MQVQTMLTPNIEGEGGHEISPLAWEIMVIDIRERENPNFLKAVAPVGQECPSEWPHTQEYVCCQY